jgi:hypothetical protein
LRPSTLAVLESAELERLSSFWYESNTCDFTFSTKTTKMKVINDVLICFGMIKKTLSNELTTTAH